MVNLVECLVMATSAAAAAGDDANDTSMAGVYDAAAGALAEDASISMGLGLGEAAAPPYEISSAPSARYAVSQCLSTWLIKTHTHFHGSDELRLPWYFGALCWSYAVGGMMMLIVRPKWTKASKFPYRCMAWMLILLQAPLSFAADYLSMTDDTYIHTADRLLACPMMVFELCKALTMMPHVRWGTFGLYMASVAVAIGCFVKSSQAQEHVDADAFIFWHNCWHVYPLLVSVVMGFDYFVLGEYDREAAAKEFHVAKTPRPLSTVVMEQAARSTPSRGNMGDGISSTTSTPLRRSTRLRLRTNAHAVTASS